MVILGQFEVDLKHPRSTSYWATKNPAATVGTNWRARPWIDDVSEPEWLRAWRWTSTEFWVHEDDTPAFDLYPLNSAQNTQGYVEFMGYHYAFEEITQPGQTILPIDRQLG